jgi:hypothetical protein
MKKGRLEKASQVHREEPAKRRKDVRYSRGKSMNFSLQFSGEGTASKAGKNLAQIVVQISRRLAPRITRPTYATRNHYIATEMTHNHNAPLSDRVGRGRPTRTKKVKYSVRTSLDFGFLSPHVRSFLSPHVRSRNYVNIRRVADAGLRDRRGGDRVRPVSRACCGVHEALRD